MKELSDLIFCSRYNAYNDFIMINWCFFFPGSMTFTSQSGLSVSSLPATASWTTQTWPKTWQVRVGSCLSFSFSVCLPHSLHVSTSLFHIIALMTHVGHASFSSLSRVSEGALPRPRRSHPSWCHRHYHQCRKERPQFGQWPAFGLCTRKDPRQEGKKCFVVVNGTTAVQILLRTFV